jgi:tRNA 2-thiocytidine biosynthesis protein TtcA
MSFGAAMAYVEHEIRRLMGKAIHHYRLIDNGDRILVAISGGKDSLAMLNLLHERKRRVPIKYDLKVVTIDLGFEGSNFELLKRYVESLGYEFGLKKTKIGPLAQSSINRESPCFLCARLRRKLFFETAQELGCNKLALGHHKDDIIETFLMNVLYTGEISTMVPYQPLFKGTLVLIRPLSLIDEDKIQTYVKLRALPEVKDCCPSRGMGRRAEIKRLVGELSKGDRRIKRNIYASLSNVKSEYLIPIHVSSR